MIYLVFVENRYYKYADNENGLSVSKFEELVNCSLGLSECIDITSDEENPFSYMINCTLNSALSSEQCDALRQVSIVFYQV